MQFLCQLAISLLDLRRRGRRGDTENVIWIFHASLRSYACIGIGSVYDYTPYFAATLISGARRSLSCFGNPANPRNASAIFTRPLTPVMMTSTMVKDEWNWPRALSCSTGTPALASASP